MKKETSFALSCKDNVVLATLSNVPNRTSALADIFSIIAAAKINVDMISQTAPYKEIISLSFTIDETDLTKTFTAVAEIKKLFSGISTEISAGNCKFMIYGELLKTECGIAARLFKSMSDNNLQIKLITTSDAEISILLDRNEFEKINSCLKQEFKTK